MKKSEAGTLLKQLILEKESEHEAEGNSLKIQFHETYESLKPINLLKHTLKDLISAPDIKTDIVNAAVGFSTGYVAKKLFTGNTHNPLTKLAGVILEMVVANKVAKNADGIKSIGSMILHKILHPRGDTDKK